MAVALTNDALQKKDFVIRNATSAAEVRSVITKLAELEGWRPAIDDPDIYYNTDPSGFFIAELDGKMIGSISIVKYGQTFAFGGLLIVQKEYRGHDYGLRLFKHAFQSVPSTCNISGDGVLKMLPFYRKYGFVETYRTCRVEVDIAYSSAQLQECVPPPDIVIQPAKQVEFDKLSAYDNAAFGAPHHRFLKGLLDGPNTITLAATSTAGEVVGFVAARKTIIEEEGWKIAPLYADSEQIVRAILKEVLQEMSKDSPERRVAIFELAIGLDPHVKALAEELNASTLLDMRRMYTKGPLEFAKEKVYSCNSCELG